jgi:hypothetical protein
VLPKFHAANSQQTIYCNGCIQYRLASGRIGESALSLVKYDRTIDVEEGSTINEETIFKPTGERKSNGMMIFKGPRPLQPRRKESYWRTNKGLRQMLPGF